MNKINFNINIGGDDELIVIPLTMEENKIMVNCPLNIDFSSLFTSENEILKLLNLGYEQSSEEEEFLMDFEIDTYITDRENLGKIIKNYKLNGNISIETISINQYDAYEYIKKFKNAAEFKININMEDEYDMDYLIKMKLLLESTKSNVLFKIENNDNLVDIDTLIKTVTIINEIVDNVNQFKLSPIEKVMFVYDIIKERVYTQESKDEDYTTSRDLSQVLLGDKIVCVGFTNIFDIILKKLNFQTSRVILSTQKEATYHIYNEVFIVDDKYNIDGIYVFDATFDSNKKTIENEHLYKYKYFALSKENYIDKTGFSDNKIPDYKKIFNYSDNDNSDLFLISEELLSSNFEDLNYYSKLFIELNTLSKRFKIDCNFNKYLMHIGSFTQEKIEQFDSDLYTLFEFYDTGINSYDLFKLLCEVRKQQYYSNPEKYPYSLNDLVKTLKYSTIDGVESLYFTNLQNQQREIESVKLTRTLRNILDNKVKNCR